MICIRTLYLPWQKYVGSIATALEFQTLDLDVHRRKWSLTFQGLEGVAGESEVVTRKACISLAKASLGVKDAKEEDLAACHRLKREANAGVILRFRDLSDGTGGSRVPEIYAAAALTTASPQTCPPS